MQFTIFSGVFLKLLRSVADEFVPGVKAVISLFFSIDNQRKFENIPKHHSTVTSNSSSSVMFVTVSINKLYSWRWISSNVSKSFLILFNIFLGIPIHLIFCHDDCWWNRWIFGGGTISRANSPHFSYWQRRQQIRSWKSIRSRTLFPILLILPLVLFLLRRHIELL